MELLAELLVGGDEFTTGSLRGCDEYRIVVADVIFNGKPEGIDGLLKKIPGRL